MNVVHYVAICMLGRNISCCQPVHDCSPVLGTKLHTRPNFSCLSPKRGSGFTRVEGKERSPGIRCVCRRYF